VSEPENGQQDQPATTGTLGPTQDRAGVAQSAGRTRFSVRPVPHEAVPQETTAPAPVEPVEPAAPGLPQEREQRSAEALRQPDGHRGSYRIDPAVEQVGVSRRRPRLVVAGLGALALVLAVLAGFLVQTLNRSGDEEAKRQAALDAARDDVRAILAYDYRHLDKDYAAARAVITGPLRKEYDATAATKKMSDDRVALKASLVSEVLNAAIETSSGDRATALVFVNRTVRGTVFATPQVTLDRIEMTLVRQHGKWLVEKLQMR